MSKVILKPTRPSRLGIVFDLDDDETITGGVGGWESLDRPRNSPATAWVSTPAKQLEIPLLLEGQDAYGPGVDRVVEGSCRQVERWGLPTNKTDEPPVLAVIGLPRVDAAARWVLQDIAWGEYVVNDAGQRVMQAMTVTLLEYARAELVASRAKRARKRRRSKKNDDA